MCCNVLGVAHFRLTLVFADHDALLALEVELVLSFGRFAAADTISYHHTLQRWTLQAFRFLHPMKPQHSQ